MASITLSAAELLLHRLQALDVAYIFINSGTDYPPVIEAWAKARATGQKVPELVICPHENAAIGMAHGYYLGTGKVQAVMVHTNVGLANAACGVINLANSNIPVLIFGGRTPISEHSHFGCRNTPIGYGQEMRDQAALIRESVKWDFELRLADQIGENDEFLRGILVYSRRDGQETENNSGTVDAYPANWHSDAFLASGIWQPNDEHKLTSTFDYYHKTNHTHYDTWDSSGNSTIGTANQTSQTRRWGLSLKDDWTPMNDYLDSVSTKIYYQHTEAHDWTYMPDSVTRRMQTVNSNYDTDTWGLQTALAKTLGRHDLSAGFNASTTKTQRPFSQSPIPSVYSEIMQPEADSRSYTLGGFVQDKINFDLDSHNFAIIPGVRVVHQSTKPENLSDLAANSSVLTESSVANLYGKNSDTQVLPSLTFQYDLTPRLMTYLQYQRGAQFPNASQLYGSLNLGSSYAGSQQYALIGNTDLKTETSDNLEWGLKGEVTEGITVRTALFYNSYKNFIAYTRYTRANNPGQFTNVPSNIYTIYQAENRDKAYIYGGEISTKFNFGTWFEQVNGLSTTLALGYSEGKSKSSYSGDKYVDLDSVVPMKAIVGVAWDDPAKRYGTALTATFVKGKQATATNRESYSNSGSAITDASSDYMRVPGYGMLDWTAYWQVAKNVRLNGGVYNLTDRKYWDYLSSRNIETGTNQDANDKALAVMPGRTWQLGVNVDF